MIDLKLEVIHFSNNDVIATSGHETSKHYIKNSDGYFVELLKDENDIWSEGNPILAPSTGILEGELNYLGYTPEGAPQDANSIFTNVYIKEGESYILCDVNHYGRAD